MHSVQFYHFLSHFETYARKSKSRHKIERYNKGNIFVLFGTFFVPLHSVQFYHFLSHFEIYARKSKSRHRIERSNIENVCLREFRLRSHSKIEFSDSCFS